MSSWLHAVCVSVCVRVCVFGCFFFLDLTQLKECKWAFFTYFWDPCVWLSFLSSLPFSLPLAAFGWFPFQCWLRPARPQTPAPIQLPLCQQIFPGTVGEKCELTHLWIRPVARNVMGLFSSKKTWTYQQSFHWCINCWFHLLLLLGLINETCKWGVWSG